MGELTFLDCECFYFVIYKENNFADVNAKQNPTLQHYTRYEVSALKNTVLAMEDLQLNTSESTLIAIRNKYNQEKVHFVLIAPERLRKWQS